MAGALERARAGGAGTPVRFTVSITRRLTSAGQEHYNTILLWTVSLPGAPNPSWRSLFDITKPKSYPSTTETKTKPKMSKYTGVSTTANAMVDGKASGATAGRLLPILVVGVRTSSSSDQATP